MSRIDMAVFEQALIEFLEAEFGDRIAPYDWSFNSQEAFEKLMKVLNPDYERFGKAIIDE
jgi:hypothetical protein